MKKIRQEKEIIYEKDFFEKLLHYEIPEQYQKGNNLLHCNYCDIWFGIYPLLLFGMGIFISIVVPCMVSEALKGKDLFFLSVFLVPLGLFFSVGGVLLVFFMKNWGLIFYKGGIWYRSMGGKIHQYSDQEVDGYVICMVPKYRHIIIKLKNKCNIRIGICSKNYGEAQQLVQQRYANRK